MNPNDDLGQLRTYLGLFHSKDETLVRKRSTSLRKLKAAVNGLSNDDADIAVCALAKTYGYSFTPKLARGYIEWSKQQPFPKGTNKFDHPGYSNDWEAYHDIMWAAAFLGPNSSRG